MSSKTISFIIISASLLILSSLACNLPVRQAAPAETPTPVILTDTILPSSNIVSVTPLPMKTSTLTLIPTVTFSPIPTKIGTPTLTPSEGASAEANSAPDISFSLQDPPLIDERIVQVKDALQALGYEICPSIDGFNSPFYTLQAEQAVRWFQAANDLEVNGVVGADTWMVLFGLSPVPAPTIEASSLEFSFEFPGVSEATDIAAVKGELWMMPEGFGYIERFVPASSELYFGIYALGLPEGEEDYTPVALASDGEKLWAAFLNGQEGLLQAYVVSDANPIEGYLSPVLEQSIHFEAIIIRGLSYDGLRLWVSIEDAMGASLLAVDPVTALSAESLPFQFEQFPGAAAYDPISMLLWAPVEGALGDQAILALDPVFGLTGQALGICGRQIVFDGKWLWVAKNDRVVGIDPASREVNAYAQLPNSGTYIKAIFAEPERLWILDSDGVVRCIDIQ